MRKIYSFFLLITLCLLLSGCWTAELNASYHGATISAEEFAVRIDEEMQKLFMENNDNYASYFTQEQFLEMTESYFGEYGGIGIYMLQREGEDYPWVLNTMYESPAESAGVLPGDRIVSIDGESTLNMDLDFIATKVKGDPDTKVTLGLLREDNGDDHLVDVTVIRDIIETESVTGNYLSDHSGIAYIAIFSFTEKTPEEFKNTIAELSNKEELNGLIIDLRNNGGGSLGAAVTLASYFIKNGEVVIWQKKVDGSYAEYSNDGRWNKLPVVILQNNGSASAAEVFTGALKDYRIATTVGELSFGKGITQTIYNLPSGAAVRFTESRYYTPNKYDLHGKGLEPDIYIGSAEDFYPDPYNPDLKTDSQLEKALEIMIKKIFKETNNQ